MLASWVPEGEDDLKDVGDFLLEVVDPSPEDVDGLTELLRPAFGDVSKSIAEFMTMDHPVSSLSRSTVQQGGGIDDSATVHFRAIDWVAVVGGAELGSETLVVRPLRIVGRNSAVVVAWRAARGYPRYPSEGRDILDALASRLPGEIMGTDPATQARLRGDPEWLVEFEHGVGHEGPSRVPQMLSEWEDGGGPPGEFAEALFSQCVFAAREVATDGLASALDRWEAALLERTRKRRRGNSVELPALADLGAMVDFVGQVVRTVGPPSSHEPEHYFTPSPSSAEIRAAAEDAMAAVQSLRERVRTGLALVSAVSTSQALEVAQETQSSNQRFQRIISVLGAAILGPTLVAGLFGANTAIPGKEAWWGFAIMIALMILSAVALLAVLRWLGSSGETE
jgi:CorA-like Mg2+ transporter protein